MRPFYKILIILLFSSFVYSQNNPGARYGHSMVNYGGKIYLFGGAGNNTLGKYKENKRDEIELQDVWTYCDSEKAWLQMHPINPPPPRKGHSAVVWNGQMIIYGGEASGQVKNDLWSYNFTTNQWYQLMGPSNAPAVSFHAAAIDENTLFIAGGKNKNGNSSDSSGTIDLNNSSEDFKDKPLLPEPLHSGALFYYNSSYNYVGGVWNDWDSSTPGDQPSFNIFILNLLSQSTSWNVVSMNGIINENSKFAGVLVPDRNEYYQIGGENYNATTNMPVPIFAVTKINLNTNNAERIRNDSDIVFTSYSAAVLANNDTSGTIKRLYKSNSISEKVIFIYGGLDSNGVATSNFYKFDPADNSIVKIKLKNELNAPSDFRIVSKTASSIDLNWVDNSSDETGFKIERKTETTEFIEIAVVDPNVTSYSNTGLQDGTRYTYRVFAVNAAGSSEQSNYASGSTTLPAPSGLTVTITGNNTANLSWNDNSQNEESFSIERKTGTGTFEKITDLPANTTTFNDLGVSGGNTYTYRVFAFNSFTNSQNSNEASVLVTGIGGSRNIPSEYALSQNYPNPFNPSTRIKFNLPETAFVKFKVFDICGREVAVLINSELAAGYHEVEFNADHLTSGIYLYKIQANKFSSVKKLILIK